MLKLERDRNDREGYHDRLLLGCYKFSNPTDRSGEVGRGEMDPPSRFCAPFNPPPPLAVEAESTDIMNAWPSSLLHPLHCVLCCILTLHPHCCIFVGTLVHCDYCTSRRVNSTFLHLRKTSSVVPVQVLKLYNSLSKLFSSPLSIFHTFYNSPNVPLQLRPGASEGTPPPATQNVSRKSSRNKNNEVRGGMLQNSHTTVFNSQIFPGVIPPR